MSAPPKTAITATGPEEAAIREAVRSARVDTLGPFRVLADETHTDALLDLLQDPAVSEAIYDLPRPLTHANIRDWIRTSREESGRGEGLLVLTVAPDGQVMGYSKITVWPQHAAAELAGALRAGLQGTGGGGQGATWTIGWIFEKLGVRMICLTAALDNVRSIRLIDRMGFRRMGERDGIRPDGTTRRSHYWEMTREEWGRSNAERPS
ncbi:MAG: GNAT family protein [Micropepsaceae bacterium]